MKLLYHQPRYKSNNDKCVLWSALGPLNNWRLISFVDIDPAKKDHAVSVTRSIFKDTLRSRTITASTLIEENNYAAIATNDSNALSGYYICSINSPAYVLQHTFSTNGTIIPKGELVCDITWLNPVPSCRTLFYPWFERRS